MADAAVKQRCYKAYKSGVPVNDLANRFGVTRKTIGRWCREIEKSTAEKSGNQKSEIEKSEIENQEIDDREIEKSTTEKSPSEKSEIGKSPVDEPEIADDATYTSDEAGGRRRRPLANIWGSRALSPVYPVDEPEWCKALGRIMEQKEVTITDLSARCGVAKGTISQILSCKRTGNLATWVAFSKALGIRLGDIETEAERG